VLLSGDGLVRAAELWSGSDLVETGAQLLIEQQAGGGTVLTPPASTAFSFADGSGS
jgi:hypothetical protein